MQRIWNAGLTAPIEKNLPARANRRLINNLDLRLATFFGVLFSEMSFQIGDSRKKDTQSARLGKSLEIQRLLTIRRELQAEKKSLGGIVGYATTPTVSTGRRRDWRGVETGSADVVAAWVYSPLVFARVASRLHADSPLWWLG